MTDTNRRRVCRVLCNSGKFEIGEGICALICFDQLGDARRDCSHIEQVHGKLADEIWKAIE